IILPVVDCQDSKHEMAPGIHNTEYACIYDCDSHTYEWLATNDITQKPGNLSIELKRKGVKTIVSSSMPLMALGLFIESGFTVYKASSDNLNENIQLFEAQKLDTFTTQHADEMKGCSSNACSSCSSTCN
ncbi:NifB/NifX family molybdenum-iron cluster-binding protein, partial [bacterium]|nr:NifB/NifX family molybdenum-iron cluster-binding protein [bacterium]